MNIPNFKILDLINSNFKNIDLSDYHVFCVQHVVASTISLFNSLFQKGLDPKNLSVLGKCYSTRPEALNFLISNNVDVSYDSLYFNPYNSFDIIFKKLLIKFFRSKLIALENKGCKRLIVIDDGGELLLLINSLITRNKYWQGKIFGLEQTSSGYDKLKTVSLRFPVLNVARSNIKLLYESPYIARIAVDRLLSHLNQLHIYPKNALIIGNGAIGSQIFREIKRLFYTEVFDLHKSKSTIGYCFKIIDLKKFDLILGCTGKTAISSPHLILNEGTCLASISSSDREFDGANVRKSVKNIVSCHQDILSNGIYLLNCGFPINFDDAYEQIDTDDLQLTRAIILGGIYQLISGEHPNQLIALDGDLQSEIYLASINA